MSAAIIPAHFVAQPDIPRNPFARGDGMTIDMASQISHAGAYASGVIGTIGGLIGYVEGETSAGTVFGAAGMASFGGLVYFVVRDLAPKALDTIPLWLANRKANIETEGELKHIRAELEDAKARNAALEAKLELADAKADEAALRAARAETRVEEIERRQDHTDHQVAKNASGVRTALAEVETVKQVVASGSGDRDPESAI